MNNKKEQEIKPNGMPVFQLDLGKWLYLAVKKETVDKLVFVYALRCPRQDTSYTALAEMHIATFDNSDNANIYYETICQAIEHTKTWPAYRGLLAYNQLFVESLSNTNQGR